MSIPEPVEASPEKTTGTPEPAPRDEHIDKLKAAALWYTSALGLTVVRAHYPVSSGGKQSCSCKNGIVCRNVGKHPIENGFYENDEYHIKTQADADEAWSDGRPWNVYVLVGHAMGVLVFDVDPRHGGTEAFERLADDLKDIIDLRDTFHYVTSDGGAHYYYRVDDPNVWKNINRIRRRIDAKYHGIELKGPSETKSAGGVIAAPSQHRSGERYTRSDTAPLYIQKPDSDTWSNISNFLLRAPVSTDRPSAATTMAAGRGSWSDTLDMENKYRSSVGVAAGGTIGYENLAQQMLDGVEGTASRIVEFYAYHGYLPEQSVKFTHSGTGRNNYLVEIVGKAAGYCFGDPMVNQAMYEMWKAEGGDENIDPSDNRFFPTMYFDMCTEISAKFTDPQYHVDRSRKYASLMTRLMLKEWGIM